MFKTYLILTVLIILNATHCISQTSCLDFKDSILYDCKIKKISQVTDSIFLLTIKIKQNNDIGIFEVLTCETKTYTKLKKFRKNKSYKMHIKEYYEPYTHVIIYGEEFRILKYLPFLIKNKIIRIERDKLSPILFFSQNTNGLYYIPPHKELEQTVKIDTNRISDFANIFIHSIGDLRNEKVFYNIVDSVELKQNLVNAYSEKYNISKIIDVFSFICDSIYYPHRKLDSINFYKYEASECRDIHKYLLLGNKTTPEIIFCQDSIINVRIKWKTANDFFPRMAMIAIKIINNDYKIIGFVDIVRYKGVYPCR